MYPLISFYKLNKKKVVVERQFMTRPIVDLVLLNDSVIRFIISSKTGDFRKYWLSCCMLGSFES